MCCLLSKGQGVRVKSFSQSICEPYTELTHRSGRLCALGAQGGRRAAGSSPVGPVSRACAGQSAASPVPAPLPRRTPHLAPARGRPRPGRAAPRLSRRRALASAHVTPATRRALTSSTEPAAPAPLSPAAAAAATVRRRAGSGCGPGPRAGAPRWNRECRAGEAGRVPPSPAPGARARSRGSASSSREPRRRALRPRGARDRGEGALTGALRGWLGASHGDRVGVPGPVWARVHPRRALRGQLWPCSLRRTGDPRPIGESLSEPLTAFPGVAGVQPPCWRGGGPLPRDPIHHLSLKGTQSTPTQLFGDLARPRVKRGAFQWLFDDVGTLETCHSPFRSLGHRVL